MRMVNMTAWLVMATMIVCSGCDVDSYMDPSNTGRWEHTPVVLPILERLDVIDEPREQIAGLSEVTGEDLIPDISEYVIGPGDTLTVTIRNFIEVDRDSTFVRRVDELGDINLPEIKKVQAAHATVRELEERIADILDPAILRDPLVTVVVENPTQRTFSILGVSNPGSFVIRKNNFRLWDAVALGGGLPPDADMIYIIRHIPLYKEVQQGLNVTAPATKGGSRDDDAADLSDPASLLEQLAGGSEPAAPAKDDKPQGKAPTTLHNALEKSQQSSGGNGDDGRYIFVNGKWVLVKDQPGAASKMAGGSSEAVGESGLPTAGELVTQRVIGVDAKALQRGEARWNIVIRPDDVIQVPREENGYFYLSGDINRPGAYTIRGSREITLTAAIASAAGLSQTGVPERVDLIRRIGDNQQATVRLNYRAIAEGVQPNIFLKPGDEINIGTNLGASFLSVIRNSFRMSYGFGFLLDRNFGTEVFGPLPRQNNF